MNESPMTPRQIFEKEKFYFSFSSLSKLLDDPKEFYRDYVLKERESLDEVYLKVGQLMHCFVLNPEEFDDLFVVLSANAPTSTTKQVVDMVFAYHLEQGDGSLTPLTNYNVTILTILREIDKHQSLKTDQQRLEKIIDAASMEYFTVLQEGQKKTIVDMQMLQEARTKADAILNSKYATKLLTEENSKQVVKKEMELSCELPDRSFGLKGIIDVAKFNYSAATIYVTDLKKTSKKLEEFRESFDKYKYWMQAMIYKLLIQSLIPEDNEVPWTFEINFLVVDKKDRVYAFKISDASLISWEENLKTEFDKAEWHNANHIYDLPYDYERDLIEY